MPWKECSVIDERLQFVARRLAGEPMADLCFRIVDDDTSSVCIYVQSVCRAEFNPATTSFGRQTVLWLSS
jgi:hypothetical protein